MVMKEVPELSTHALDWSNTRNSSHKVSKKKSEEVYTFTTTVSKTIA